MGKSLYSKEYEFVLEQLKAARIEAGFTQKDVADKLGKPQSYISKCESGERRVDIVEMNKLAKLYNKPLSFFTK